ncbi:MAG TPA: radical SAM protein [Candidatus Bathyarchaeia archaeon]|nr:radical SAM protein [Candidatus Bathyarchaeia archaeon]
MEVLLVNPPDIKSKYKDVLGLTAPALGLAYIGAVLEENDVKVTILDAPALDMDLQGYRRELARKHVDLLGVQTTTPTIKQALAVGKITKELHPECTVTMGGYHATFMPEQVLRENDFVDVVVRNEGEYATRELVDAIENEKPLRNIDGINYRDGDRIVETPKRRPIEDLDALPFPARHLLPMREYMLFGRKQVLATMICSRGCPMGCSFCASSAMHGRRVRFRSPENAADEMEQVVDEYKVRMVGFMDDTFTLFPKWVHSFCKGIISRGIDVVWGCTARVDRFNKELLSQMWKAGCRTLLFGVESGNQKILDNVQKGTKVEQAKRAFKTARDIGMHTIASMTLGMPGENKTTIDETIGFAKWVNPDYALFSLATPYPGTKFYELASKMGLIRIKDWTHFTLLAPVIETVDLTLRELQDTQREAFKEFYLRPNYVFKQLSRDKLLFALVMYKVFKGALKMKSTPILGTSVDPHAEDR